MNRPIPSPRSRAIAQRVLAREAGTIGDPEANLPAAARAVAKLRRSLTTLAGIAGFYALLSRALTRAKAQAPALDGVQVKTDGSLEGLNDIHDGEAGVILIAHVVELLTTFIGEYITLRLVEGLWPSLPTAGRSS